MNGLYEFIEGAIKWHNIAYSIMATILASLIFGFFISRIRESIKNGIIVFLITEAILVGTLFMVRDNFHDARLKEIRTVMSSIPVRNHYPSVDQTVFISSWRQGLRLISKNPSEVGLYISTVKYLEEDKDYESAATLIELGLDFIKFQEIPVALCEKLRIYYRHLPRNRPKLDEDCRKIHQL